MTPDTDVKPVAAASITSWDDEAGVVIAGYGVAGRRCGSRSGPLRRRCPGLSLNPWTGWGCDRRVNSENAF